MSVVENCSGCPDLLGDLQSRRTRKKAQPFEDELGLYGFEIIVRLLCDKPIQLREE